MQRTRVELLHRGKTGGFEYWTDQGHRVFLCRADGQDDWHAIVDGDLVVDRSGSHVQAGLAWPAQALAAATAEGLAPLLAIQEGVHCLLDDHEAWDPARPGRLAPVERVVAGP